MIKMKNIEKLHYYFQNWFEKLTLILLFYNSFIFGAFNFLKSTLVQSFISLIFLVLIRDEKEKITGFPR